MEHLALLKRWFYRSTRSGEIFFADVKGGLPLRRLVRGIARVYRGEKPETAAPSIEDRVTGSLRQPVINCSSKKSVFSIQSTEK